MNKTLKFRFKIVVLIFLFIANTSHSKNFESQFNFKFNLPEGYEIFNNNNLYDVYNHSNKDPLVKAQINLAKKKTRKPKN